MAAGNHILALLLVICVIATSAAADESLATRPGRKERVSMKRELVDEVQIAEARRKKPDSRADFGDPEEAEEECLTSGPVRFGNVTWSGVRKQTMEGVGGSLAFYTNWITNHPEKDAIYRTVFGEMKPSILRLRNSWDSPNQWQTVEDILKVDAELFQAAKNELPNRVPKVFLTSWSPPASLKRNGILGGSGNSNLVKGNDTDLFVYDLLAKFWLDGLAAYANVGIKPKFIGMNEPDYQAVFDSAKLGASESYNEAGFFKAFDTIYEALHANMSSPPAMIGPESAQWDNDFLNHPYMGNPRMHALSGHLYGAGDMFETPGFFERLDEMLENVQRTAKERRIRQVFATEFAALRDHMPRDPIMLARTIYTTLTKVDAGMYLHWDLAWADDSGEGSLLLFDNPFESRSKWKSKQGFRKTASFDWFIHFTRYILPGMTRVVCDPSTTISSSVKSLCFVGFDGTMSIIMINFSTRMHLITLGDLPVSLANPQLYSTSLTESFTNKTHTLPPLANSVFLPGESISTLHTLGCDI